MCWWRWGVMLMAGSCVGALFKCYACTSQMYPVIICVASDGCLFSCVDHIHKLCVFIGHRFKSASPAFMSNSSSYPAGGHSRLVTKTSDRSQTSLVKGSRHDLLLFSWMRQSKHL